MRIIIRFFALLIIIFASIPLSVQPAFAKERSISASKVIVVDAGHGGPDSGARGVNNIFEKEITLAVARKLAGLLRQSGAIVIETRSDDIDLSTELDKQLKRRHRGDLKGRLGIARKANIDAFVSVHCNAGPSPEWRGAQVLYLEGNQEGEELAKITQSSFRENLLPTKRGIESNRTLYLLKRIKGPAILAEIGFVTNPEEAAQMIKSKYQAQVAFSLYISLIRYFDEQELTQSSS